MLVRAHNTRKTHPVFGTCAGLIMMSDSVNDPRIKSLNYIDITAERNGWGRQVHSFNAPVNLNWENGKPHGLSIHYHENGQKKGEVTYKDGEQEKETTWWSNGQKKKELTYKDGRIISGKNWNRDGSVN